MKHAATTPQQPSQRCYVRTKEDEKRDAEERRWKDQAIQQARVNFIRKYPTGKVQ